MLFSQNLPGISLYVSSVCVSPGIIQIPQMLLFSRPWSDGAAGWLSLHGQGPHHPSRASPRHVCPRWLVGRVGLLS